MKVRRAQTKAIEIGRYCIYDNGMAVKPRVLTPRVQAIVDELREWCDQGRGRRVVAAKAIGTSKYAITHWFSARQGPSPEQCLAIVEFLKKERRSAKRSESVLKNIDFE
jgi:hypothetical protein